MEGVSESAENEEGDFTQVVETLVTMFGELISKEVAITVVESCGGDLNLSLDAIMNITTDSTTAPQREKSPIITQNDTTVTATPHEGVPIPVVKAQESIPQPSTSYAAISQSTGPTPILPRSHKPKDNVSSPMPKDQLSHLVTYHKQGSRLMVILRGASGSGKSYLARQIVSKTIGSTYTDYNTHIFSSDDFFMSKGRFMFDKFRLSEAHMWNQKKVWAMAGKGLSPIIIDNTNIELWEMEPYVRDGIRNGYIIELLEPNTPWARKASQLVKLNAHNVPFTTIKRMLNNYQNITGPGLLQVYKLSYPAGMVPPIMRNIPTVSFTNDLAPKPETYDQASLTKDNKTDDQLPTANFINDEAQVNLENFQEPTHLITNENTVITSNDTLINFEATEGLTDDKQEEDSTQIESNSRKLELLMEAQQSLEEIIKVEQEWENGDSWDSNTDNSHTTKTSHENVISSDPKPPRNIKEHAPTNSLMESVNKCKDWKEIYMYVSPWHDMTPSSTKTPDIPIETVSSSTCVEAGDTDVNISTLHKIVSATPRDINEYYMPFNKEKIPEKRMLDKSSMTNDQLLTEAFTCKSAEKHFVALRKLFKNVARPALRDIFDNCCGDVNWAVDIILSSMANQQFESVGSEDMSDTEEESIDQCDCLAAYNIIPDGASSNAPIALATQDQLNIVTDPTLLIQKKSKKDFTLSEASVRIKRQIEKNVVISDNHYSDHCLKIRKIRRGECDKNDETCGQASTSTAPENFEQENPNWDPTSDTESDDELDMTTEEPEKFVNINMGTEFQKKLDDIFGRGDMQYPDTVKATINIPMSILSVINALWIESIGNQLDEQSRQSTVMIKQDEDFARQLAKKEAELSLAGIEPAVPDFKEILDMDLALSLYQKDVAEWRNNEPNDLAAKLTRDKLYNLFPEVPKDTLSELLMAHDNNFQATVEGLLMSTGKMDILQEENGINKFVVENELLRKQKILKEERKALSEIEWPYLTKGEVVQMSTVNNYREEADKHLIRRNKNYMKAQECIHNGMTQIASFYSDISAYHKEKFDIFNNMAAVCLMQLHAANNKDNATVDLHFLRVDEATTSLDIYLDTHIRRLKETQGKNGRRKHAVYIITGRGKHSPAGPRVKPAVKRRLRERGLFYSEMNPGLLRTKLSADSKLSHEIV